MFKRHKADLSARVLPLRNAKISLNTSGALALPTHVWFTPEQIILDAFGVIADVVWLWQIFRKILPVFVLRLAALTFLAFILISPKIGTTVIAESIQPSSTSVKQTAPLLPTGRKVVIQSTIVAGSAPTRSWPVPRNYISTYYSGYHQGIDLPTPYGSPVRAFEGGTVIFAGWDGGFGKIVIIKHIGGLVTKYAHLSAINVKRGAVLNSNTTIGRVGITGFATGPHLHFETHTQQGSVNPLSILP